MYFQGVKTRRAFNMRGQPDGLNLQLRPYRVHSHADGVRLNLLIRSVVAQAQTKNKGFQVESAVVLFPNQTLKPAALSKAGVRACCTSSALYDTRRYTQVH